MRNPEDINQSLARTILQVRGGRAASRRDLAESLGVSATTAGYYTDELIARSFLRESGVERGLPGRPKRRLETVPGAGWFAGVEFNAERVRVVGIDFSGQLAGSMKLLPAGEMDARTLLAKIASVIEAVAKDRVGPLLGIGVGAPGVVDPRRGAAVAYAFLPGWSEVPAAGILASRFGVPVTLENNLRAIALAERWFGGAQDLSDYVVLGPRSGFGIAVVQAGALMRGVHNAAGEVGYWPWPGSAGESHLHDQLSSPAVWRRLAGKGERARLPADLHAALGGFSEGTGPERGAIVRDYAKVIAMLHWLLDPSVFFLHGPLTALGERFCDEVAAAAAGLAHSPWNSPPLLRPSTLDDNAGALGAASMAMERWHPGER